MADTYTQIYLHVVFAVKGRQCLIPKQHKEALHQYITRIIANKTQTLIQINSVPDHIHILIGMTPDIALSDLVRDIKANSSTQRGGASDALNGRRVLRRSRILILN